ncbi:hypothetical protein [Curtobacterium sp. MCSS17_007]|uniref:hypothetical protein n=1 Tax=Curtobacterium sp. MCSS17_007 TaxID=2175646 RepID=UPI000DA83BB0|nr:hypothetical protein [Curtobacterium sp. MCSS17_007]WIE74502.1 hypothetical protein DEJ22_009425 [Curtobacterium sp. MCSS17_007]
MSAESGPPFYPTEAFDLPSYPSIHVEATHYLHLYADPEVFTMEQLKERSNYYSRLASWTSDRAKGQALSIIQALDFEIAMRTAEAIEIEQIVEYGWIPEGD